MTQKKPEHHGKNKGVCICLRVLVYRRDCEIFMKPFVSKEFYMSFRIDWSAKNIFRASTLTQLGLLRNSYFQTIIYLRFEPNNSVCDCFLVIRLSCFLAHCLRSAV